MSVTPIYQYAVTQERVKARLVGLDAWFIKAAQLGITYDADRINDTIQASVRKFERETQFDIIPRQYYSFADGTYNTSSDIANVEEPAYTYYERMAQQFFTITLNHRPLQTVQRVRFMMSANQAIYTPPSTWIRFDARAGKMSLIPDSGAAAITTAYGVFYLSVLGGNSGVIPNFISIDYKTGLPDEWWSDYEWSDLRRALECASAIQVLEDISETFDAGAESSSEVSIDGISQRLDYSRFMGRKAELQKHVDSFQQTFRGSQTPIGFAVL